MTVPCEPCELSPHLHLTPLTVSFVKIFTPKNCVRNSGFRHEYYTIWVCLFLARQWVMASSFTRFLDHTQRRATVGRTSLDEWSARRRDLYLTTHNRQMSMPPVGFEPTVSTGERPLESAHNLGYLETINCLENLSFKTWDIKPDVSFVHILHLQLRYFVQMLNLWCSPIYFMRFLDNGPRGPKHVGFLLQIFGGEVGGGVWQQHCILRGF